MSVIREDLLIPIGTDYVNVSVARAEPAGPARGQVLCLHGYAGNARDFAPLVQRLVQNGFALVMPDLPGRGDSASFAAKESFRFGTLLPVVSELRNRYAHPRVNFLLAEGYGAALGLIFAAGTTRAFQRLVLMNLPMPYLLADDPAVADARHWPDMLVPSLADAVASGFGQAEYGPTPDLAEMAHRFREMSGGAIVPCVDPVLFSPDVIAAEKRLAIKPLLKRAGGRMTLMGRNVTNLPTSGPRVDLCFVPGRARPSGTTEQLAILGAFLSRR